MARLGDLMKQGEAELRLAIAELTGDRDEQWRRVSAMAGVDEYGCLLPPPVGATISREPVTWWKNKTYGAC